MLTRLVAAAAVLVSGYVHLDLWFAGTRDLEVIGPAFLLNAVASVVIAGLLLAWKHWLPLLLTIGFGAATLGAFVISATVGLYGVNESFTGFWQWTSIVSEAVAIVAGLVGVGREGYLRPASRPDLPTRRAHVH